MEKTKKDDFVEIEFVARIKDSGTVFDTNISEEAQKAGLPHEKLKPLKICVGHGMVVKGLDKELEGKETGKKYAVDINPDGAFGKRSSGLVRMVPMSIFAERQINPVRGLMLNMDGMLARISSVSGGRVMVDFNNPLAGKVITYEFVIKKIIVQDEEKLKALSEFFTGEVPEIKLNEKKAEIEFKTERNIDVLKKKAKEMLDVDIVLKEAGKKEQKEKGKEEEKSE